MYLFLYFGLCLLVLPTISVGNLSSTPESILSNENDNPTTLENIVETETSDVLNQRMNLDDCDFAPGLTVGNRKKELQCCNEIVNTYHESWLINNRPLNRYLETLYQWNCPQFEMECRKRLFSYNQFTELMYDKFCMYEVFVKKCLQNVSDVINVMEKNTESVKQKDLYQTNNFQYSSDNFTFLEINSSLIASWKNLIKNIDPSQLTLDDLLKPCIQIAQYDQEEVHNGSFQEIVDFGIPFCGITWCGFSRRALESHNLSLWSCLNPHCKANVVIIIVVCALLGLAIAIANILIVLVISVKSEIRNSQAIYKISLAVADFLVGVIVLPLCIENLRRLVWTRIRAPGFIKIEGYDANDNSSLNITSVSYYIRAGTFLSKYPQSYQNFAGFVTAVSIFVSVYTLAGASFDRLKAVSRPFDYKRNDAYKASIKACLVFWVVAIVFGILPVFLRDIRFVLIISMVFATLDISGFILYSVTFFIPLLVIWIANLFTFVATKRHGKFRRSLTLKAQKRRQIMERRLAATLRLMVGFFTLGTLPLLLTILFGSVIPYLSSNLPKQFSIENTIIYLDIQCIAVILLFANSLWNFFIYSNRNKEFRIALKDLLAKMINKTALTRCIDTASICIEDGNRKDSLASNNSSVRRKNTGLTLNTKSDLSSNSVEENNCCHTNITSANGTPVLGRQKEPEQNTPVRDCSETRSPRFQYHGFESFVMDSPNKSNIISNVLNDDVNEISKNNSSPEKRAKTSCV